MTPELIPATTAEAEPIVPIPEALLVHVPEGVTSLSVTVEPTQTFAGPVIAAGDADTLNVTTLPDVTGTPHPARVVIFVIVNVVAPALGRT